MNFLPVERAQTVKKQPQLNHLDHHAIVVNGNDS